MRPLAPPLGHVCLSPFLSLSIKATLNINFALKRYFTVLVYINHKLKRQKREYKISATNTQQMENLWKKLAANLNGMTRLSGKAGKCKETSVSDYVKNSL